MTSGNADAAKADALPKLGVRGAFWSGRLIVAFAVYIAGALWFFRWQIFSGFDLLFGDRGDARMVVFIHEHLYRWLQGHSGLLSPPFFFNQTKTLGYSDGFLMDLIIYAPLRLIGTEPVLALSLVVVILSPIAFVFVYVLLRRFDVSVFLAALGALLFTFANNLYLKSGHLQHFAVYYIPVVAYCGLAAVSALHRRPLRACLLGGFAAGLFGLLFSTGYYMAWFFGLALLIAAPIGALIAWPAVRACWRSGPRRVVALGVVAGASFLAALSIFAVIYAPVLALGFRRGFGEYLIYAPNPVDIVNVGMQNLVWSAPIRALHLIPNDRLSFGEVSIALTPTLQVLTWVSGILALQPHFWPADDFGRIRRALVISSAVVCLLFYVLTVATTHHASLFRLLYAMVPGASAIRVGYRGMVVANLFAVTATALTFDRIIQALLREPRAMVQWAGLATATAVLALTAIEQVNLVRRANLSRIFERQHLAAVSQAPPACRTFYVAPQTGRTPYEVQIDAMMVALTRNLSTINGYSGFSPPGWDFYDTNAPGYRQRAILWAVKRGIGRGLCELDVEKGTWTLVDFYFEHQ